MAEVQVLQPGLYSSVQDNGRFGFRRYGVPQSGSMDMQAAGLANLLLKNDPGAALLEITLQGPKLIFSERTQIAITGADLSPQLGSFKLENYRMYTVEAGDMLSFGTRKLGYRAYLAIMGGFKSEVVLGSRSWCPGVTKFTRLEKGMKIPFLAGKETDGRKFSALKRVEDTASEIIKAFPGPEFDLLNALQKEELEKRHFSAAMESNRMGIQFQEKLENSLNPILTSPVLPGTVQLTPSGTLIALMRDGQTTGGYPRVLQLEDSAINKLAQKLPGEKFQLKLVHYKGQ